MALIVRTGFQSSLQEKKRSESLIPSHQETLLSSKPCPDSNQARQSWQALHLIQFQLIFTVLAMLRSNRMSSY